MESLKWAPVLIIVLHLQNIIKDCLHVCTCGCTAVHCTLTSSLHSHLSPVSPSVECDHCLAAAGQPRCQLTHLSPAGARCTNVTWLLHSWACSSHAAALAPRFRNSSVEWKTMTSANYNECTRVWTKYTQYPFSTFNSTIGNGKYEYEHSLLPQQQA